MAIVKVIEVISEGDSVENAVTAAVDEASKTVRNIRPFMSRISKH